MNPDPTWEKWTPYWEGPCIRNPVAWWGSKYGSRERTTEESTRNWQVKGQLNNGTEKWGLGYFGWTKMRNISRLWAKERHNLTCVLSSCDPRSPNWSLSYTFPAVSLHTCSVWNPVLTQDLSHAYQSCLALNNLWWSILSAGNNPEVHRRRASRQVWRAVLAVRLTDLGLTWEKCLNCTGRCGIRDCIKRERLSWAQVDVFVLPFSGRGHNVWADALGSCCPDCPPWRTLLWSVT